MSNYQFGPFRLEAQSLVVTRDGEPLPVGRRGALLLKALLERRGQVVTKDELIDAGWGGAAIEESNLSVQVARLRQLLGEDPEWITTVPRIGYRFRPDRLAPAIQSGWRSNVPTVTLQPFALLSGGESVAEVAAGLADDLAIGLSRFRSLRVAQGQQPLTDPAFQYTVEGTVRSTPDGLRLGFRLIEGGFNLWAATFDVEQPVAVDALDRLSASVATQLERQIELAETDRQRRNAIGSVWATYVRARPRLLSSSFEENAAAIGMLQEALALEPENQAIIAALCEGWTHRLSAGWSRLTTDDDENCFELGRRGMEIGADDPVSLALFGAAMFRTREPDYGHALQQRAADMNANSIVTLLYAGTSGMLWGSIEAAEWSFQRSVALNRHDPRTAFSLNGLGRIRMIRGDFEEALRFARLTLQIKPNNGSAMWTMIAANTHLGRLDEAGHQLEKFKRIHPGVTIEGIMAAAPSQSGRMASTLEGLEAAGVPVRSAR